MTPAAQAESAALRRLARLFGVQTAYFAGRTLVRASPEALLAVLRSLGAPIDSAADAPAAIRQREDALRSRTVPPVHVAWDGAPSTIAVNARTASDCRLLLEDGEAHESRLSPGDRLALPPLPIGYHELTVRSAGEDHKCLVISAPTRAYTPAGRPWGVFIPLYAVRSRGDWGVGDFAALARLCRATASAGASFVATLPLFASFLDEPFNPSPYAPVSRLFWNELFINIDAVPEIMASPEARSLIAAPAFRRELARLRAEPLVDYRGAMAVKRRVLALLAASLGGARLDAFERYVAARPVLRDYARFRAAVERYAVPWQAWGEPARSGRIPESDLDADTVRYHEYVQWVAEEQLSASRQPPPAGRPGGDALSQGPAAPAAGLHPAARLFLDLPIGSSRDGYDVWRDRSAYALEASVGAPPDAFFSQGQDWGFPPPHPDALRSTGYALFIAVLRRLGPLAGALRIDHVMGLHRLFWVPAGLPASQGVYVRYNAEEAFAILCLESVRNATAIVGEDLGIVPACVESSLARHNISGMYVMQFHVPAQRGAPVRPAPRRSLALLGTHDLPPFAGWLAGADIDDSARLGLIDADTAARGHAERAASRENLGRFLRKRGLVPAGADTCELARGALRYLAAGPSRLMIANLEDLWAETRPQNIPGTSDDVHPNWRRKAARSLEEIESGPDIAQALRELAAARAAGRRG